MSLLKTIDPTPSFSPREAVPTPERLISGNPSFKTWAQDAARDETIHTGVWEATPGLVYEYTLVHILYMNILLGTFDL